VRRYVPGAGDDEETWAQGLTPDQFWQHWDGLLRPGPAGLERRVRALAQGGAAPHRADDAAKAHRSTEQAQRVAAAAQLKQMTGEQHARGLASPCAVRTDAHHPAPLGCAALGGSESGRELLPGLFDVQGTPFALADRATVLALGKSIWEHVRAVLDLSEFALSLAQLAVLDARKQCWSWQPVVSSKRKRGALHKQLPCCVSFIKAALQDQDHAPAATRVLIAGDSGAFTHRCGSNTLAHSGCMLRVESVEHQVQYACFLFPSCVHLQKVNFMLQAQVQLHAAGASLACCVAIAASLKLRLRPNRVGAGQNSMATEDCEVASESAKLRVRQELAHICQSCPGVKPMRADLKAVSQYVTQCDAACDAE
jgi:Rit1 N-terminal domain/Rit1 DUSP-like domain